MASGSLVATWVFLHKPNLRAGERVQLNKSRIGGDIRLKIWTPKIHSHIWMAILHRYCSVSWFKPRMCKIVIPPGNAHHESPRNLKHSIKETPGIRTMRCSKVRLFFSPGALLRCCCFTFLSGQGASLEVLVGGHLQTPQTHPFRRRPEKKSRNLTQHPRL